MRVAVEASVWIDTRYDVLAAAIGVDRYSAVGRMTALWAMCTERETEYLKPAIIAAALGIEPDRAAEVLDGAELGQLAEDGSIRIRGCSGRTDWLRAKRASKTKAGRARAKRAARNADGSFSTAADAQAVDCNTTKPDTDSANADGADSAEAIKTNVVPLHEAAPAAAEADGDAPGAHEHLELARKLWAEQERLRGELRDEGIACRPLSVSAGALEPVVERLTEYSAQDCRHVLAVYAAEARGKSTAKWFNGITNWRKPNFRRALSTTPREAASPPGANERRHYLHTGDEDYQGGVVQL